MRRCQECGKPESNVEFKPNVNVNEHVPGELRLASTKQVGFCRTLFRKSKLYYNCLDDEQLAAEVLKRTGFDLDNLSRDDAVSIIDCLSNVATGQRPHWRDNNQN